MVPCQMPNGIDIWANTNDKHTFHIQNQFGSGLSWRARGSREEKYLLRENYFSENDRLASELALVNIQQKDFAE